MTSAGVSAIQPTPDGDVRPIGVFDSGLGGLRVLDRLVAAFPQERFVYLGDTQHMPYGHKTREQVQHCVEACLDWFFTTHPIKLMVVACNTAASVASDCFKPYTPVPFVDPVTAMCRWLHEEGTYHPIGIMATPATVASNRYRHVLDALGAEDCQLHAVPCENLATVIEEGGADSPECQALLETYIQPLRAAGVQAIVLGCTHYPYAQAHIAALAPDAVILNPERFMVQDVTRLLGLAEASSVTSPRGTLPSAASASICPQVDYFVTADADRFYEISRRMVFQALVMKPPTLIQTDNTFVLK